MKVLASLKKEQPTVRRDNREVHQVSIYPSLKLHLKLVAYANKRDQSLSSAACQLVALGLADEAGPVGEVIDTIKDQKKLELLEFNNKLWNFELLCRAAAEDQLDITIATEKDPKLRALAVAEKERRRQP